MTSSIPCASLYVGDLHPDVTEAVLYEKFQQHGNVLSIRVCRDLVTRKSLGYAYVNYQTPAEAKAAMDQVNFDHILGRACRIMWSQRDPASRRSGVGNIFIKNLDSSITVKEINDTFANFGEITSCKLQQDDSGNSKGFAFVNFSREEDAEKAIQAINGKMIRDKLVYVAKFIPRTQRMTQVKDYTNCYIKNFGNVLNDQTLQDLFEKFGEIVSAKVMVDKDGVSKGFGFVSFKEHDNAARATTEMNGFNLQDKVLYVGRAMKKSERQKELKSRYDKLRQERIAQHKTGVNLYIKNLSNEIDDSRLKNEFANYGNITSAKVMLNKENNTSKGFGFVCFSAPDEATRAVSEMNGKIVEGKPLYVALAQKKEDRVAHLRNQFSQRSQIPPVNPGVMNPNLMGVVNQNNLSNMRMFPRQTYNLQTQRWPGMPYIGTAPANAQRSIMNFPAQTSQMMLPNMQAAAVAQQPQRRGDPMLMVQQGPRNARPITGNLSMSQGGAGPRAQYSMVANNGTRQMFGYPDQLQGGPTPSMQPGPVAQQPGAVHEAQDAKQNQIDPNITSQIANADSIEAKQLLGEKIYPMVMKYAKEEAGKITGMFLELDNAELLYMIENENTLRVKIEEALAVLKSHNTGGAGGDNA